MIHNFTPQTGTGRKSQAIRELQKAVRKITPRSGANVYTKGTAFKAKKGGEAAAEGSGKAVWL